MNSTDFVSLYTHVTPFDGEQFTLKTFEIYATYDYVKGCTRITIINADTKHKCVIYLDYIQENQTVIIKAAQSIIQTNILL